MRARVCEMCGTARPTAQCPAAGAPVARALSDHSINTDRSAAVSNDFHFSRDMHAAPRGVKLILLGAGGVAIIAQYNGKDPFWQEWAPMPRRSNEPA